MFWKKRNGHAHLDLGCQVGGCDFACHDYRTLQRHAGKMHAGLDLECKAIDCDYVCTDYMTLEKHTSWAHPAVPVPSAE
jgi:hypothetical protein